MLFNTTYRDSYHLFTGFIEEDEMNKLYHVCQVICVGLAIATFLLNTGRIVKAIELCKECLIFLNNEVPKQKAEQLVNLVSIAIYRTIFMAFCLISDYKNAIKYGKQLLDIYHECGKRDEVEGQVLLKLGMIYEKQYKYVEAGELYEKAINVMREIGDRRGEAAACGSLGVVFSCLGKYDKAKEYLGKALALTIEIGDRAEEAMWYGNLGIVFKSLGEYHKAKEYIEKALSIKIELGDRKGGAADLGNLGNIFQCLGECDKAKEFLEKALAITIEIGDRKEEAICYGNLGTVFTTVGEYHKAKECIEKALSIKIELGDRKGTAVDLAILGNIFQFLGECDKAKEYLEKALAITIEIGDKKGEADCYGNLGTVFQGVNEYDRAKEYYEKALAISSEIGDRRGEATDYINLGAMFGTRGVYEEAKEHFDKALAITVEIDDRAGEASCYGNIGSVFKFLGEYDKAKQYFQKALLIRKEIGDRAGEAAVYLNLGSLFFSKDEPVFVEGYLEKALSISQDIGTLETESACLFDLMYVKLTQEKIVEAFDYMFLSLEKSETLRGFLRDNDQFKISLSDGRSFPYQTLAALLVFWRNDPNKALYVVELARARALADLMATQYSVERQISADPQSWIGIENIIKQESNCSCLYISNINCGKQMFLWIIKTSGVIHFRTITVNESDIAAGFSGISNDFFATTRFQSFGILPEENCEDRSLNDIEPKPGVSQEEELGTLRQGRGENDPEQNLTLLYNMLIAPVVDLLEGSEIIIVPEPCLYRVPFPALLDEGGKYLSETFRIRIVPSLSTLKNIQDSPIDYHSQTGALIVGDPEVGKVRFNGRPKTFEALPFARREAEMIGRLLGVQPLLGEEATKQAVLQRLRSVGLIHFAAHGDAERGEIALSPVRSTNKLPKEQDYLLTMSDISEVKLRAKLVVLSCCHSGRGKVNAEEVIGISRAFLGSGARSVLVALWALDDKATEQFMSRFYEHLVRGESASESLHQAMRWMRGNGWSEVKQWAPFMLIGDNMTFEFGK